MFIDKSISRDEFRDELGVPERVFVGLNGFQNFRKMLVTT